MGSPLLPSSLIFENFEKSVDVPDMAPEPNPSHRSKAQEGMSIAMSHRVILTSTKAWARA